MPLIIVRRRLLSAFVLICAVAAVALFSRQTFVKKQEAALAPALNATKTAVLQTDANSNGFVNPGDTLRYTVQINNTGADPALNVAISDTIDANTTLVGGSLIASPLAVNDVYASIGNVGISVPDGASDLLANDLDANNPASTAALVFVAPVPTVSAQGGAVSINTSTGAFTYTPPAGFEGADTFTYTLGNGTGLTDTATVTINVSNVIWFVNASAGTGGTGTLSNPFNCFVGTNCFDDTTLDEAGDNIFLYSGNYTGGQTLLNNQRLIGQGANSTLASIAGINLANFPFTNALPATGGTNPVITTTAAGTNAINLGQGNTIRGVTIGNTTGAKLNATSSVGTLTVGPAAGISDVILNGSGQAVNLTGGGTLAARFASISSTDSPANAININNMGGSFDSPTTTITNPTGSGINLTNSSAAFNFGNTAANGSSSTGVNLSTNTGTITFADLDIAPDSGLRGLLAQNNTNTITTTSGTINTPNATAVEITRNTGTTPLAIIFTSITSNGGAAVGIILTNTSGSFTVTGDGGGANNGSGGSISNKTGTGSDFNGTDGVTLNNVTNVSLNYMNINSNNRNGILGTNVNGFRLNRTNITGNANQTSPDEGGLQLINISGTALDGSNPTSITNTTISNSYEHDVKIENSTGTLTNFSVSNSTFSNNGASTQAGNQFMIQNTGGTATFNVTNSNFTGSTTTGMLTAFGFVADTSAGTLNANVSGSTFQNNNVGISASVSSTGIVNFNYSNNNVTGARANAVNVFANASHTQTISGTISNNMIGTLNQAGSGSAIGSGIRVSNEGSGTATILMNQNTIQEIAQFEGIFVTETINAGTTNVTITNNTIRETDFDRGLLVQQVNGGGTLCGNISGNIFSNIAAATDIRVRQVTGTTRITQKTPTGAADPLELDDANGLTPADISISGTINFNGGSCAQPLATLVNGSENNDFEQFAQSRNATAVNAGLAQESVIVERNASKGLLDITGTYFTRIVSAINETFNYLDSLIMPKAYAQNGAADAAGFTKTNLSGETVNKALGTLPPGENIRVRFDVTVDANIPTNDFSVANTAQITASNHAQINSTTATTTVVHPPTISKAFGESSVAVNATTSLTFTIGNANPSTAFTNIAFTDNLPDGLKIATPNGLVNNCGGGTVTATADSGMVSVSALARAANSNCTIVVNVTAVTEGVKNNVTSTIGSTEGGTGTTAMASLTVQPVTSANVMVGGRVLDTRGRGIADAQIQLTDEDGNLYYARANPFGFYRVNGLEVGKTYVVSIRHKRFEFAARAITVNEELTELNFVATSRSSIRE